MTRFKGPFSLIRELLKYAYYVKSIHYYPETGILEIVLAGRVVITARIIEGMEKSGFVFENSSLSVAPEYIDHLGDFLGHIHEEDDVPEFISTTLLFKDTDLPPLENSNTEASRMEPLKTELIAAGFESPCIDPEVDADRGEDISQ